MLKIEIIVKLMVGIKLWCSLSHNSIVALGVSVALGVFNIEPFHNILIFWDTEFGVFISCQL